MMRYPDVFPFFSDSLFDSYAPILLFCSLGQVVE